MLISTPILIEIYSLHRESTIKHFIWTFKKKRVFYVKLMILCFGLLLPMRVKLQREERGPSINRNCENVKFGPENQFSGFALQCVKGNRTHFLAFCKGTDFRAYVCIFLMKRTHFFKPLCGLSFLIFLNRDFQMS